METKNYFTKEVTAAIKWLAVIMMLVHHLFWTSWIQEGCAVISIIKIRSISLVQVLQYTGKMCVALFALLSGYGFYHRFKKGIALKDSIKRLVSLYLNYWCVLIPMTLLFFALGNRINAIDAVLSFLGIKNTLNWFCWYVPFYAIVLITMPVIHSCIFQTELACDVAILIGCCIVPFFGNENENILIQGLIYYYPVVIVGYYLGKYDLINYIVQKAIDYARSSFAVLSISVTGIACVVCMRYALNLLSGWRIGAKFDGIFAAVIVVFVTLLFTVIKVPRCIINEGGGNDKYLVFTCDVFWPVPSVSENSICS